MTTPVSPAPEPAPAPAPPALVSSPASGNFLTRAVHALEAHIIPAFKTVDTSAEKLISEALKLEALLQAADPSIAGQLAASAAVLRDIAGELAAL